jgi:hypothetical protein
MKEIEEEHTNDELRPVDETDAIESEESVSRICCCLDKR